ncbi:hypothetical protein GE21DRAFT_7300 [Neurospora crassa]|uniref:DSC E3 ubiquitin ligase complex subunit A n=1 Tax=Neurospora crassa (strain ATCC 24698 / 74-OR23-1A / CBS 708.71 / DSM 1257 / FGSC 987) TaxID=367110 RepID=F5HDM5_NEUCR|nr:hypothetical protein NCU03740 [Neurospora crassa OR74A]EAA32280.3 hypothetical protein NCU03740 [Neurospora crassa OR74A]KHE88194.1 hypothetical protein GE21DRAFT_7300 [Neurospora crassa]|eukprot:XP_961516.3 hypothetical protein NCU03740 [Neurospora crassa OR74A]
MPSQNSDVRALLIVLILLWIFFSPDSSDPASLTPPEIAHAREARFQGALDVLNTTRWGDFAPDAPSSTSPRPPSETDGPAGEIGKGNGDKHEQGPQFLNITGFSQLDGKGYAWEDLGRFRNRCREWSRNAFPSAATVGPLDDDSWEPSMVSGTWKNATGTLHGTWVRRPGTVVRQAAEYNLSAIAPGATWPSSLGEWGRNITGDHGKIELRIDEDEGDGVYEEKVEGKTSRGANLAREIQAVATIQDDASEASSWSLLLHGVHWPRQGAILLTTSSEKFDGIFGLPHLAPGPNFFHTGQHLLNETLGKIIQARKKSKYGFPGNPWGSRMEDDDSFPAQCEYVMYLQLQPLELSRQYESPQLLESYIEELERELRHPTGAPIGRIPDLRASMVAWSPDCSFFLESKGPPEFPSVDGEHLVGMKEAMFTYTAKEWLIAFAAVMLGQIWLFKEQMKLSNTPSTTGRVSFWTIGAMLFADGMIFVTACAWSLNATITLLPCLLVTFAAFISMFIEGAFLSEVWKIQEPERRIREREREQAAAAAAAAAAANRNASSSSAASTTPPPTTQPEPPTTQPAPPPPPSQPRQPIIVPSDGDIDEAEQLNNLLSGASALPLPATARQPGLPAPTNEPRPPTPFSTITGRFVLAGLFLLFISAVATSWPSHIRSFYVNTLSFLYLSLWTPQIIRNAQRNSRQAFSWRFMIGQSLLRLLPFAYFFLREDNVLLADPDPFAFLVLVAWVWIQLWVICAQSILGPRFGVPKGWVREAWDYHPVLRDDDLEGVSLPIGLARTGTGLSSSSSSSSPTEERVRGRAWSVVSLGGPAAAAETGEGSAAAAAAAAATDSAGGTRNREREKEKEREKQKGVTMRSVDCAICRELLEVPVFNNNKGSGGSSDSAASGITGVFARKAYMVTPCRHIFHTNCLEGWMKYRLQCPICREELPPL